MTPYGVTNPYWFVVVFNVGRCEGDLCVCDWGGGGSDPLGDEDGRLCDGGGGGLCDGCR